MTREGNGDGSRGREGALAAMKEVVTQSRAEFPAAVDSFDDGHYDALIRAAWRTQFDDDRTKFKREVRAIQDEVVPKILAALELRS